MTVTVVANPKGGVGKSTLAINVAGYLARRGHAVALADLDEQESAQLWLSLRPPEAPKIHGWALHRGHDTPLPQQVDQAVIDTPAGLKGSQLAMLVERADRVLIPLQPSLFDMCATRYFVTSLLSGRRRPLEIAVVANRVREHSQSADELRRFLHSLRVPLLTELRDTQNYVHLAAHGLSLWDMRPGRVLRDQAQWVPIMDWLDATRHH